MPQAPEESEPSVHLLTPSLIRGAYQKAKHTTSPFASEPPPLKVALSKLVNRLKKVSSRKLRQEHTDALANFYSKRVLLESQLFCWLCWWVFYCYWSIRH